MNLSKHGNARGRSAAGAKDDVEITASITQPPAAPVPFCAELLAAQFFAATEHDERPWLVVLREWRLFLELTENEQRVLRLLILRRRCFTAAEAGISRVRSRRTFGGRR